MTYPLHRGIASRRPQAAGRLEGDPFRTDAFFGPEKRGLQVAMPVFDGYPAGTCFINGSVKGHDFSRAEKVSKIEGF
jgi:hypothetical protein